MAAYFKTSKATELLKKFDARIAQTEQKGKITTWVKRNDGYYTHKAADWANKAFFKAVVEDEQLRFNIIRPKDKNIEVEVYGYYHGHLIETFLNHFDKDFTWGYASALPSSGDDVSA
ncbi:hypothetical protein [Dyella agri]|uniref:Uncharacterized protein n=1 Tax=Dyella agri TaxID=1926869 RepID=A0ABW8KHI3_9GAMM